MPVPTTLEAGVTDVLDRLGDLDNKIWTRAETELHLQDGYDLFCNATKCLFDVYMIENLPQIGNWQTDLERFHAQSRSGWGLTDDKMHYTSAKERSSGYGPAENAGVGGSYASPVSMTAPGDRDFNLSGTTETVYGGTLPDSTVGIIRVAFDRQDLKGMNAARMNQIDPDWEDRTGDPQWFVADNDGLFYLRLVPAADGGCANYDVVDGSWGTLRYRCDDAATATLTYTGQPGNGEYVLVSGVLYLFVTTLSAASTNTGKVLIGSAADDSYTNLSRCINNSGGTSGTDYNAPLSPATAAATSHPTVSATVDTSANTVTLTALLSQRILPFASLSVTETCSNMTASSFSLPSTEDDTIDVGNGAGYGILRYRSSCHPTNGPWGIPRRIHPNADNVKVEVFRLGRPLSDYPFEIPDAYIRYIYYWAMYKLLEKDGPGQNMELAEHYKQRFELGIGRMKKRHNQTTPEREGRFGPAGEAVPFGLGDPYASDEDMAAPS
jgi:hypothetical protein